MRPLVSSRLFVVGTLYCIQYGKDAQPMMQGTFLSIVFAIVTIPLITVLCTM